MNATQNSTTTPTVIVIEETPARVTISEPAPKRRSLLADVAVGIAVAVPILVVAAVLRVFPDSTEN